MKERRSELKTGEVVSTKAGKLKCKTIIHAVGPVWNNGWNQEMDYLSRAVQNCLTVLEEKSYTSIAIPAISTGIFGIPIEEGTKCTVTAIKEYLDTYSNSKIKHICLIDIRKDVIRAFKLHLEMVFGISESRGTTSFNASLLGLQQKAAPMTPRTNMASRENDGIKIQLMIDSISNASVDVIINSTNKILQLNDGSISKFILNAAGPEIQYECNQKYPQGISTSEIAITKGYDLKCKKVFHLALPSWDEYSSNSILANLTQIITICLEEAERMGAKSLAFPILGPEMKYPIEKLPRTMSEAVKSYSDLNSSQIKDVYFVVLPEEDREIAKKFEEYLQNKAENEGMMDKQEKERFHSKDTTSSNTSLHVSQKEISSVASRTNVASGENAGIKIQLLIDSISDASVDVIVNSTNKSLQLNSGAVSKSILNAAGPQIQNECNEEYSRGISISEIAVTKGYNLNCKNVFHLALPYWNEYSSDSKFEEYLQNKAENEGMMDKQEKERFHSKDTTSSKTSLHVSQKEISSVAPRTNETSRENAGIKIQLSTDSISNASVDVIVNSTNRSLRLNIGAISKSILNAAGPQIQDECNQKFRRSISTSEIAITKAYKLNCKNVFHLALPYWNEYSSDSILANLTQVITTCLETAERMGAKSLAFPILGAEMKYPIGKLPRTMYEAVKNYSDQNSSQIKDVYFVVLPEEDREIAKKFEEYLQNKAENEGVHSKDTTSSNTSLHVSQKEISSVAPRTNETSRENDGIKIQLSTDSISDASVDVIVNRTNKNLYLNIGAISKSILNAAGPQIQNECDEEYPRGISTSTIAITKGYNLNCKNVFHLVLPYWNVYSSDSILANLTQIITICLENAERMGAKSLAFPILGAEMKYPIGKLPRTMYEAVKNYSDQNSSQIKDVYFVVLPEEDREIAKKFEEYLQNKGENEGMMNKQEKERFHSKDTTSSNTSLHVSQKETSSVEPRTNETSRENAGIKIQLSTDSISNASVDVIVNSTNKELQLNCGAISKSILNAAGSQIQYECNQKYPQGISTFKIAITKGYNLNCKNVFHLALPPWDEYSSNKILANLTQIITTCLENAEELGAKSLAFPILGAGVLKYPVEELPRTMYEAVKSYSNLNSSRIKDVCFVVYPQDTEVVKKFEEYFQGNTTGSSAASSESVFDRWSSMGDKELIKIVPVTNGPEYDDIQATFRRNLPSYHIIKIERIQNKTLCQRYKALKEQFEAENPKITNEVDGLWHGTTAECVERINRYGFNCRYCSKNGTYGEGVYFAKSIRYSADDTYSTPDHHKIKTIYKCSVLVGRVIQGQRRLKVLHGSYNSAVDDIQRPDIYVTFDDSQAYPNYLITFSKASVTL
ncbi:protein mono-ADP-ribosyltransferase PARP14 isoform X1 [Octopus sinensis]|uniref:Poly [ADP-ribose] polymerase n=1 Tax=Octopus sinensis TaxID=2607531 RepID=A0A6P7S6E9_9MOLL|nr:protein mono-ADP-ribosyltransferase PARP14 isoform X1 [Octopus sinensis]